MKENQNDQREKNGIIMKTKKRVSFRSLALRAPSITDDDIYIYIFLLLFRRTSDEKTDIATLSVSEGRSARREIKEKRGRDKTHHWKTKNAEDWQRSKAVCVERLAYHKTGEKKRKEKKKRRDRYTCGSYERQNKTNENSRSFLLAQT